MPSCFSLEDNLFIKKYLRSSHLQIDCYIKHSLNCRIELKFRERTFLMRRGIKERIFFKSNPEEGKNELKCMYCIKVLYFYEN